VRCAAQGACTTKASTQMQNSTAADIVPSPDHLHARLSVGLTALLCEVDVPKDEVVGKLRARLSQVLARQARPAFHADVALALAGLATRPEAEVLEWLRERGLFTSPDPPSPLLCRLLQEFPHLFHAEVLRRLDPMPLSMLAQVGRPWMGAVLASGLPRLPARVTVRLRLREFCTSVERLARARANGCWFGKADWYNGLWYTGLADPCYYAAAGGHRGDAMGSGAGLPVEPVDVSGAAKNGHLAVLRWAREQDCPWDEDTCAFAAAGGHLAVLQWAQEHGCPWDKSLCQVRSWQDISVVARTPSSTW